MKPRNPKLSHLIEEELATMLMGFPDELLQIYLSWLREEVNRRGLDGQKSTK